MPQLVPCSDPREDVGRMDLLVAAIMEIVFLKTPAIPSLKLEVPFLT